MGKKLWRHISFSSTCFCNYRKHSNNDKKICPLLSFVTDSSYLGTIQIWWNLNEHYFHLTSTKSLICQIDANCSPFQSLNMLPFHIRFERLKLTYYSFISKFSRYSLKTAIFCLFCLSSHVFAALQFDSNYFDILLLKIVKSRYHNETKPPIGKILRKLPLP